MEIINFDEDALRNQSIKRNINQIYSDFYPDTITNAQIVTIEEYYEANHTILSSYSTNNLRDRVELVLLIYRTCLLPTNEEYEKFTNDYFKKIILSYLFGQNLSLDSYQIDKNTKKLLKPSANSTYEEMIKNKMNFNNIEVLREELIKFLFQYYLRYITFIVKDLSKNQHEYFEKIKNFTYKNIQPSNVTLFLNVIIANYKRIIELYKIFDSEEIKRKNDIEELLKEREKIIESLKNVDQKLEDAGGKGKRKVFSSNKASAKLFMYDDENGFIQNCLFIFLIGLTSGLSFFFISSIIKFLLNQI